MDYQISNVVREVIDDEFALIATITFFICEAIFTAFPIYRARMKQLTSMLVGGALGLILMKGAPGTVFLQGLLAGGATTMAVARFKSPKTSTVPSVPPSSVPPIKNNEVLVDDPSV